MSTNANSSRDFKGVMVSSTFTDLTTHRAALNAAILKLDLHPIGMEYDDAQPLGDVLDSSLQMVEDSAAFILIIGQKYGQIPVSRTKNPDGLSLTELEFNEAQSTGRPMLVFIMDDEHPTRKRDIENDPEKEKKLNAFRERAKQSADSTVDRVYSMFKSLDDFKERIGSSLANLRTAIDQKHCLLHGPSFEKDLANPIPYAPAFYANPDYIGRHNFIGRTAQLQVLSEWAKPNDPTTVLLFEAIGGNGKSMLTWEWAKDEKGRYATKVRDWAGRFWYSFYEKGAIMRDFCQHALAYMTGKPLKEFSDRHTADMRPELIALLKERPWLLILDGLERVLVAYHRIDAAELRDEEVNRPTDKVLDRNPCDAIRDEDNELLRALATAAPSKILISSRLTPRKLLNQAGTPISHVARLKLPGLDQADGEELLRSCGVQGTSASIRDYLTNYCDNHPLVIAVLAGLINSPGPHRGNFDAWAADPEYGAKLNLASVDLIQNRNDILKAAIEALEPASRQLLSMLALLSNAVDYRTVEAFNPHITPEPKLEEVHEATRKLTRTIADLEQRGLLQYDGRTNRYDLHPVVRGVAAGGMKADDTERYGLRLVDYFASQPHDPYEKAKKLEDVENGLHVVRTLLKLGRYQQAADAFNYDLTRALVFSLEAYAEMLSVLSPFFHAGWHELPKGLSQQDSSDLANNAAVVLDECGEPEKALQAHEASLQWVLNSKRWDRLSVRLRNISSNLFCQNMLVKDFRVVQIAHDFATVFGYAEDIFISLLNQFESQSMLGQMTNASATWSLLDPMGRNWDRRVYRQGGAEFSYARFKFRAGTLEEDDLVKAEVLAENDDNRVALRGLLRLRGTWKTERGEWRLASGSFDRAVTMARERRLVDEVSETGLALAKIHLGQLTRDDARSEAGRLADLRNPAHRILAMLWLAIGDRNQAEKHALAAYKWAWADGEPYVHRYELTKTTELLQQMDVSIPQLPPYDPAKDLPFPWEADVRAAIEEIRAEKEKKNQKRE